MSNEAELSASREADRVYVDLRTKILTLELEPGSVLDEARIVQQTGVSRTPVREAVIRLVSEGLLKRDGRQIVVPAFQVGQLRPFFEALQLLTRATHRMAAERRNEAQLAMVRSTRDAFEAEAARGDPMGMNDANYAFHRAVARAADSSFLQEAYEVVLVQSLWLARQCFVTGADTEYSSRQHVTLIVADHAAIVAAIEGRDPDEVDRLASSHCDLFRTRLSRQLMGPSRPAAEMLLSFDRAAPSGTRSSATEPSAAATDTGAAGVSSPPPEDVSKGSRSRAAPASPRAVKLRMAEPRTRTP